MVSKLSNLKNKKAPIPRCRSMSVFTILYSTTNTHLTHSIPQTQHPINSIDHDLLEHNVMLPDHIEFTPNIAPVCPCFND